MEKASFDQEVNTLTAEAELAYELQVSSQIDNYSNMILSLIHI